MSSKAEKQASPAKLLIGVAGIYGSFMYYGLMQAEVVKYTAADGSKLEREWFLQVVEAAVNVFVGLVGLVLTQGGPSPNIPYKAFAVSGTTQVLAKAMTQKAMIYGVPFFVATLVKNAKMVPVMLGAIVMSGKSYSLQKYLQVGLIIAGVVMVSVGKAAKPPQPCGAKGLKPCGKGSSCSESGVCELLGSDTEMLGMLCLMLSLFCDGVTGGTQDAMNKAYKEANGGKKLQPYDLMLFTNLFMMVIALLAAFSLDQFFGGVAFVSHEPALAFKVAKFAACSAAGQSAIFFTLANFDPLVTTTVTTTRKIFSVLLDIFTQGHVLAPAQWSGVAVASMGVALELQEKFGGGKKPADAKK